MPTSSRASIRSSVTTNEPKNILPATSVHSKQDPSETLTKLLKICVEMVRQPNCGSCSQARSSSRAAWFAWHIDHDAETTAYFHDLPSGEAFIFFAKKRKGLGSRLSARMKIRRSIASARPESRFDISKVGRVLQLQCSRRRLECEFRA